MQFDTPANSSWKFGHRGRVAVFIDGNNLFHAARFHTIDIDYNKLLRVLLGDGRLLRAFFYTGVDAGAERQQGFLLWMRRNGFRVIQKELKTFYDGTRKANLDVEIAVDMLSLAGRYDTAVLVSGDEDCPCRQCRSLQGVRVESRVFVRIRHRGLSTLRFLYDLGEIMDLIRKDGSAEFRRQLPGPVEAPAHVSRPHGRARASSGSELDESTAPDIRYEVPEFVRINDEQ